MPNNVKESQLREALKRARLFIEEIYNSIISGSAINAGAKANINSTGSLVLSIESLDEESLITDALHGAVRGKDREVWTRKAIERLFNDALQNSLRSKDGNRNDFPNRLNSSIETLERSLRGNLYKWDIIFPVVGLRIPEEGIVIGNVNLQTNANEGIARVLDILAESTNTEEEKADFATMLRRQIEMVFNGASVAVVTVEAAEIHAAKNTARQDILETIDILNYFSIALYPRDLRVRIHLATETPFGRHEVLAFQDDEKFSLELAREDALQEFDFTSIESVTAEKIGLSQIRSLLVKGVKTEMDRSIINAARIAGKAHVAGRHEDGFLLFAIAIESLIVGGKEQTDLTYKLSTRCAHLLGNDLDSRKTVSKDLKELYGIRSAIAHRGQSSFPEEKLTLIRRYALRIIRDFLTREEFREIETKVQLASWFDELMLK